MTLAIPWWLVALLIPAVWILVGALVGMVTGFYLRRLGKDDQ